MKLWPLWLLVGAASTFASISAQAEPTEWRAMDESALNPEQTAKVARAVAARNEAMGVMMGTVQTNLKAKGPGHTITVCSEEAPAIIADVARKHSVKMGRTSHRLRNPKNVAPAWAESAVKAEKSQPRHFVGPNGAVAMLTPIPTAPPCLSCHGDPAGLSPEVKAALAKRYPADRATGFAVGDLRGWFWVEAP